MAEARDITADPQPVVDLEATMRLMDVADEMRRQHQRAERHVEQTDRDRIKAHVMSRYEAMGERPDETLLDEAIETFLSQQHRFRPPPPGPGLTLARWYVRRGLIARRVGVPVLCAVVLAGAVWGVASSVSAGRRRAAERVVEQAVAQLHREHRTLVASLERLRADPLAADAVTSLDRAAQQLDAAAPFLADHAPGGDVETHVTPSNYRAVEDGAAAVRPQLAAAGAHLREVESRIERTRELRTLAADATRLHESIKAQAREPAALADADEHRARADRYVASGDLVQLRNAVAQLADVERRLGLEYRIVIVGGVWRYENRNRGNRNYYLRVQAVDDAGRRLEMRITNEETGRVETVREWAERVPKDVYDRIAADKGDNGLIDDDEFGVKQRGYLTIDRSHPDVGQITRW